MDIQNTREYKAAQDLERALNDYGWNPEKVCRKYKVLSPYIAAEFGKDCCSHYKNGGQ